METQNAARYLDQMIGAAVGHFAAQGGGEITRMDTKAGETEWLTQRHFNLM
jgi:hypothetical protein